MNNIGRITIDLGIARNGILTEALAYGGTFIRVESLSAGASAQLMLDDPENTRYDLENSLMFQKTRAFTRIFILNTAQPGKSLTLSISYDTIITGGSIPVTLAATAVQINDSGGTTIDPATETSLVKMVMLEKGHGDAVAALAATDILGAALTPTNVPSKFVLEIMVTVAGTLTITRGAVDLLMNSGNNLIATCLYKFDIQMATGDTFNFKMSNACNVTYRIIEQATGD